MSLKEISTIIFSLLIITSAITSIFYFIGINFSVYGNYLMWIWVLVLFFIALPREQKSLLIS
jgi:hypothetical protein